jgi:hypothetical protein
MNIHRSGGRLAWKEIFIRSRTIVKGSREHREKRGTATGKRGGSSIMETNERIDSLEFALETEELKQ